jgi:putative aldouronate transport system substrate-binding protein
MKIRILALLCVIGILITAGCSKPSPEKASAGASVNEVEISIAVLDNVADNEWSNAYHQYFMKKFNVKWDYNYVEWGSWQEKLRIWINAGDLPDISIWDYNYSDVVNYAEQGLIYKFPADWKQRWPNAAKAYNSSPLNLELERQFGGTYIMLRPVFVYNKQSDPIVNQIGVIGIRKDWAKDVGFELKDAYTVNETLEFARLIRERDPGKVGNALLPLCYDPRNALTCIVSANSRHSRLETAFYKNAAGQYQWGGADEDTFAALEIYKKAYDEGLLPVEFYLMDDDDKEKFYINGTAALYHLGGVADFRQTADTELRNNLGLNSDDVIHEAIVLGNDNKYHNIILGSNFWSSLIFSPDIKTETFERLMDFIDFTCTEEGQIICNMGFEGQDWEYQNGKPVSILPENTSILDKYGSRIESIYILEDDFAVINPAIKEQYRTRMNGIAELKLQYGKGEYSDIDWKLELYSSRAKDQATLEYHTEYANLILQPGNLRGNWEKWVAEKMRVIGPYLDELNGK